LLQNRGIIPNAFLDQVRGQVTWNALVARRLRPSVQVTEEDVEEIVGRITANSGLKQRRISEIFLSVDTALQEDEILRNAERLFEQLRAGANFSKLARQFSESASAARGGDLGWVREGQLSEELESALAGMQPGTLSRPIRTLSGFHILVLRDEKTTSAESMTLHLKQLLFALAEDASDDRKRSVRAQAEEAREKITGCAALDDLAAKIGASGSGDLGKINVNDLPPKIRNVVVSQPIGQPTPAVLLPGGFSVLVVCERTESGIDRNKIKNRLISERLDMLARRYMRDLRQSANVDIRQ
jgi:peptidyl-prolyl cis-trans isomerase SurA